MKGKIEAVSTKEWKGKNLYSMKVGDSWYGCGAKSPGNKGDVVEFDVEESGNYKNAGNIRKVEGAAPAASSSGTDWAKKDQQISWQAARNSAHALIAIGVSAGFQDAPDTFSKLVATSNKLTQDFFNSTLNLGSANLNALAAVVSKPPPPMADGPEDDIPF